VIWPSAVAPVVAFRLLVPLDRGKRATVLCAPRGESAEPDGSLQQGVV